MSALDHALFEKSRLHGIARQRPRGLKMSRRDFDAARTKFELADCSLIKGTASQAILIGHLPNFFESPFRSLVLRDGDCPIQRYNRRWTDGHEVIVLKNDLT